jgi:cell division transport system permease protein
MKIERLPSASGKTRLITPRPATATAEPPSVGIHLLRYYLRDVQDGIRRNLGAVAATVLLIFISLTFTGVMVLLKSGVDDVIGYLNDQVKIKLFVDPGIDSSAVADILRDKPFITSVEIETREDSLNKLEKFFRDMPHLFDSFRDSKLPDAILIEVRDKSEVHLIASELAKTSGITDVIYAQEFAEQVVAWSRAVNTYGVFVLLIFFIASVLTVSLAMNLSLHRRQKDIRVKLLVGAKESHVRGQFLLEGVIIGFIGSLLAAFAVYLIDYYALYELQRRFSAVFDYSNATLNLTLLGLIAFGMLIGLIGTHVSTRKMMKHA